jgi:tetratricopeptide (TPR) repeat protein
MKKTFGPTHALILVALLNLILAPRPIAGTLELKSADRFDAAGDYAQAASAYVSAAQRLPWQPSLWEKAGDASLNGKDYYSAEYYYKMAFRRHALSPSGYMGWGDTAFVLGDPRFAVDLWNGLIDKGGDPSILLPRIARGYQALKHYSDEIQAWQKYLIYQPGDAAAHYRLGLLLAAASPADGLPELMQAAQLDPGLDKSVQSLRTALNTAFLSDDRAYQFLISGRALGALGEWDLAAEAFRHATIERADYAEAWAWLGEARQHLGLAGADELQKAIGLNSKSAMVQGLYGMYLQRQGQPDVALAAFHKAADLEPDNSGWQMAMGSASEQTGDLVAAYEYYFHAVELAPEDASTWRALVAFSVTNDVEVDVTGLPAARKLIGLAPNDWQSYDLAGQAEFLLEDYTSAETYLKKAVQMSPTQAAPALHLGLVYMQIGDRTSAYSYLNLARMFDPDGPYGWQAGRLLEQYFP